MLAESFSGGLVRAMDPLDLYKNQNLVQSKHVYFVSISGNTITNIKVAKTAKKSIAITSKPQSKLAEIADETILLQAPTNNVFTAGSITFLESALTCISLVKKFTIPNCQKIFIKAKLDAKKFIIYQKKSLSWEISLHFLWQCIVLQSFTNFWVMMHTIVK